jgi:uncharacterized protein (TIGR02145 family)/prepilin-type N-terminal cleavage/methylation domain-containing protein
MTKTNNKGFTLIELLVVIAIIGVLTTIAVISLADVRTKARDTKRTTDIKQIGTALETYFAEYGYYPTIITPGEPLASPDGTTTYIAQIPSNPTPREDNGCPNADYAYTPSDNYTSYTLSCCIGTNVSDLPAGTVTYTPSGWSGSGEFPFANCGDNLTYGGESYPTVQIGTQCWFKKNLNYGTMLCSDSPYTNSCATNPTDPNVIEKYCYYNNEIYNYIGGCSEDGGLYQWQEMMNLPATCSYTDCSIQTPHQGICPTGWHIPTDNEWYILENYLKDEGQTCDASRSIAWDCADAGGKLKEAGTTHWSSQDCGSATCNSSGFTALGAGYRDTNGLFKNLTGYAYFWQASQSSAAAGWSRLLLSGYSTVARYGFIKVVGFSVRCLKD